MYILNFLKCFLYSAIHKIIIKIHKIIIRILSLS